MSTPAGWYDDPTRGGRLRYWDGARWTEWVSEDGQTASEPIVAAGTAPASEAPSQVGERPAVADMASATASGRAVVEPTPGIAPAPAAAGAGAWGAVQPVARQAGTHPAHPVGRIGHLVAAAGGLLAAFATGQAVTRGAALDGILTYKGSVSVPLIPGLLLLAGGIVAAIVPNLWARLAGHVVAAGSLIFLLLFMIGVRSSDSFVSGTHLDVKGPFWFVAVGSMLSLAGLLVATFFFVRRASGDDGRTTAPPFGVIGLVLSIVGVLIVPLAALGGAAGKAAQHDNEASSGRIGSRGIAIAAFWVGLVLFALWGVGLLLGGLLAQP